MNYVLFLDDMRNLNLNVFPPSSAFMAAVVVRNEGQFKEAIESLGLPFAVSFDHDLHADHYPQFDHEQDADHVIDHSSDRYAAHRTGWHCAAWMKEKCAKSGWTYPAINVHSRNVPGAKAIAAMFEHEHGGVSVGRMWAD